MFRPFSIVARAVRPCRQIAVRGKKDYPIPISFWRPRTALEDPWYFRPMGIRVVDEHLRDTMRCLADQMMNRPLWYEYREHGVNAEIEKAELTKEGMEVMLNVSHYAPQELTVKVMGDRLLINGKHSNKPDEHGYVTREFTRELLIPEEVDHDTLTSRVTEDGHLLICAKIKTDAVPEARTIDIEQETQCKE